MGQRLNLEISRGKKPIANAYYHWSAYTESAYELTNQCIDYLENNMHKFKDDKLLAIRALESTGAGLPEYEEDIGDYTKICNLTKYRNVEFQKCSSRNEGIIGCFKDSIETTQRWAEGSVFIDLDDLSICFDVLCYYDSADDIKEYYEEFDESTCTSFDYDLENLTSDELSVIVSTLNQDGYALVGGQYISEIG